jgi:hypothetical protein
MDNLSLFRKEAGNSNISKELLKRNNATQIMLKISCNYTQHKNNG